MDCLSDYIAEHDEYWEILKLFKEWEWDDTVAEDDDAFALVLPLNYPVQLIYGLGIGTPDRPYVACDILRYIWSLALLDRLIYDFDLLPCPARSWPPRARRRRTRRGG